MSKVRTAFFCSNCGHEAAKWVGKCPSCGEWNTFQEEIIEKKSSRDSLVPKSNLAAKPMPINEISGENESRIDLKNKEFNRVLGGGLVKGSMVLIGGEPGIGKSTIMLQTALKMTSHKILYTSGEESLRQIKLRAERIGIQNENCLIYSETAVEKIVQQAENLKPDILVIDSIQTLHASIFEASPGSVTQIRECTAALIKFAKQSNIPTVIIGHITKDGQIAGPKILEHMVDTVLQFEGDRNNIYRILRSIKNRFGSTNELGIFEMRTEGLVEVDNPSQILMNEFNEGLSGVGVAVTMEGLRPMLIETQALVTNATYGNPQRSSTGFDLRRLSMLLAVLEKKCGFKMGVKDVFLNMAGGLKVDDPATDLAIICAILSSMQEIPIEQQWCFSGEIGLSGEIRPVSKIDQRIFEAEKLGMAHMVVSSYNFKKNSAPKTALKIHQVAKIEDVFNLLFT